MAKNIHFGEERDPEMMAKLNIAAKADGRSANNLARFILSKGIDLFIDQRPDLKLTGSETQSAKAG